VGSYPHGWYETNALSKFSPNTELVLYPLQDKLTSVDKSLDLSAFKLSRLLPTQAAHLEGNSLSDYSLNDLELVKDIYT
ncbi:hypothetical protein Tco_0851324, partial [Tanacetum coccineum]